MKLARTRSAGMVVGMVATMFLAACGGDEAGGGDPQAAVNAAREGLSGEPVRVGVMLPIDSPALSRPANLAAARVAEMAVNERGGIQGRPLEIVFCDDKNDVNLAATCAQDILVNKKAVALAGTTSLVTAPVYPILEQVDTVNFGSYPLTPVDFQNPRSYPFNNGTAGWNSIAATIDPEGVTKVAVVTSEGAAAETIYSTVEPVLKARGIASELIAVPLTTSAFQPVAARVKSSGADAIILAPPTQMLFPMYTAFQQQGIGELPVFLSGSNLSDDLIENLADQPDLDPRFVVSAIVNPALSPVRKQYEDDVAKYGDQVGGVQDYRSDIVANSWLAVTSLAKVLEGLATIDGPSLRAYLDKQSAFETGLTHPLDFTRPAAPDYPRAFNPWVSKASLMDGRIVQESIDWVAPDGI